MDEIQFIVSRLNEPPFENNLTLVDFDDKNPMELLQMLVDIFEVMDSDMAADVREVDREGLIHKLLTFLSILKFKLPEEEEREHMVRGISEGDKNAIYPIMHWALQRLPQLQKRAYLAKYLVPEGVPQEFMSDEVLVELHGSHKQLQEEFKGVHKSVDRLRAEPTRPSEVKTEIATLEDERKQLNVKITRLKQQTEGEGGFPPLLAATTALRQQQDEDSRLEENRRRQLMTLQHARQRHEDAAKRLQALKRNQSNNATPEQMLGHLEEEVKELTQRVKTVMPRELEQESARLAALQEQLFEPQRSGEDVEHMGEDVRTLERRCAQLRNEVEDEMSSRAGDNKLAMFRQTAAVAARKLAAKEEELEKATDDLARAKEEVDEKESALAEVSGPKFMTREEFKAYGNQLREKTHVYKRQKHTLKEMSAEVNVLRRTEQILRGRDRNLAEFLEDLEAQRGVAGYRDVQASLEAASAQAMGVDASKEATLEEISKMVRAMNTQLKERKSELAPQIKKLRDVRKEYTEVDAEYVRRKALYDKVAVGLEVERQAIEAEAEHLQQEALQEESNYHYFQNLTAIASAAVERVRNEDKWAAGSGHLLPNFRTYADLYKDKEARQKALKEQLLKQKSMISSNEPEAMEQRKLFGALSALLAAKVKCKAGTSALDSAVKSAAAPGHGFSSSEFDAGNGAKVMRLDVA